MPRYPIAASNGADVRLYGVLTKPGGATFEAYVCTAGDDTPRPRLSLVCTVGGDREVISFLVPLAASTCTMHPNPLMGLRRTWRHARAWGYVCELGLTAAR